MAKVRTVQRKSKSDSQSHKAATFPSPSSPLKVKDARLKKKKRSFKSSEKKEWGDATCSVCMEYPHNAVLLLCSSYHKGCRPYMCATSYRYSNCLDQYKKAYTKVAEAGSTDYSSLDLDSTILKEKTEVMELLCPLCRGQVKGWTVVEAARKYLNAKKRTCMKDNCCFVGNYKQLRKHVRAEHPSARPRQVDPALEANWKRLEYERERSDVISTIRSSMPGSMVLGDYVIDFNAHSDEEDDFEMYRALASATRHGRLLIGRRRRLRGL